MCVGGGTGVKDSMLVSQPGEVVRGKRGGGPGTQLHELVRRGGRRAKDRQ